MDPITAGFTLFGLILTGIYFVSSSTNPETKISQKDLHYFHKNYWDRD
jgi:hypothetical protein